MNRGLRIILVTFLFSATGCATGRVSDLRDCARASAGIGIGLGADVSLGVLSHPAIGLASYNYKVGFENRHCAGIWKEQEIFSPLANLGSLISQRGSLNFSYQRNGHSIDHNERCGGIVGHWIYSPWGSLFSRATDFEVGASLLLVNARVGINPLECVDFLLGFVGVDIAKDDQGSDTKEEEMHNR